MNKIRTALDSIRAEDEMKAGTIAFLRLELQKRQRPKRRVTLIKSAAAFASFAIILFAGVFSYNFYFTPLAYLDMDINPAVAITVNRLDRVIGVEAYNTDGEEVLCRLSLMHKRYREAVRLLIDAIAEGGYLQDGVLISATLQTDDVGREAELLAYIEGEISNMISGRHISAQVDMFAVKGEIRDLAHDHHVSPAKYLAILSLQETDPTVEWESCRNHSISEIRQMTHAHESISGQAETPQDNQIDAGSPEASGRKGGGHGRNGHGGGHH